jgi:hypothetical protein
MAKINARERRLLSVFGLIGFLVFNFLLADSLSTGHRNARVRLADLQSLEKEAEMWMANAALWEERGRWLDEKLPAYPGAEAGTAFLEGLQSSARARQITILDQGLVDPPPNPLFRQTGVRLKINGPLSGLVAWLAEQQQPDRFVMIQSFSLKSDPKPPNVICEIILVRCFRPEAGPKP